jgi:uncharacterized Zn finger protein
VHLVKRAIVASVRFNSVVACADCGFVLPESLLDAVGHVDTVNCPVCPATVRVRVAANDDESAVAVIGREENADQERLRLTSRTQVSGKEEVQDFDVFLAHNSADKETVIRIADSLRDNGLNPWLDEEQILLAAGSKT